MCEQRQVQVFFILSHLFTSKSFFLNGSLFKIDVFLVGSAVGRASPCLAVFPVLILFVLVEIHAALVFSCFFGTSTGEPLLGTRHIIALMGAIMYT